MTSADRHTATLADGRRLGWYEFGDPEGVPCVYTSGTPASALEGEIYDPPARSAGVRWISVDKPGYGQSDHDPQRSLVRYASDIAELLDHLGLDRVVTAGESGGGPHALALARALPHRLHAAFVIAGLGPAHEPSVRNGMKRYNRGLITLAQRAPWLLRLQMRLLARQVREHPDRFSDTMRRHLPEADQRAWPLFSHVVEPAAQAALHDGGRAAAQEMVMFARPWGFDLAEISTPVHIWHGTADVNVPVAIAHAVHASVPRAQKYIVDDVGHSIGAALRDDLVVAVRGAVPAS